MNATTPNVDTIIQGDCLEEMKKLPGRSIDAIVTDPPYELAFMGKKWDASGIAYNVDMWGECLRVLKPGGHLLAFGGSRTYHRMACAIEDAGFEIRDSIHWVYGSGFPKSLSIDKAIDKLNGRNLQYPDFGAYLKERRLASGLSMSEIDRKMGTNTAYSWWEGRSSGIQPPSKANYLILKDILNLDDRFDELIERIEAEREVIGKAGYTAPTELYQIGELKEGIRTDVDITAPATSAAKQWAGWGSALKPAHEPVVLARKPLDGCTIAENVLRWGCGGLNITATRIGTRTENESGWSKTGSKASENRSMSGANYERAPKDEIGLGRFPSNLIHDNSPAVLAEFAKAGTTKSGAMKKEVPAYEGESTTGFLRGRSGPSNQHGDSGSVARFFMSCEFTPADYAPIVYYAKASRAERERGLDGMPTVPAKNHTTGNNGEGDHRTIGRATTLEKHPLAMAHNNHPTVKPLSLMRYLCKLITPPGGLILDPFGGSGTTGIAAIKEGFHYILIEQQEEYCEIARKRVAAVPARLDRWAEADA